MLTRIEISGFKSFEKFSMDFGPFMVILGPNASGKSNLFDAIRLLSRLAEVDLRSAVSDLRGEPYELFSRQVDGQPGRKISFAVEVLLDPKVKDQWGAVAEITHSRVRYEVVIETKTDDLGIERLIVTKEVAEPILASKDSWAKSPRKLSDQFRKVFIKRSRENPWLSTEPASGDKPTRFELHQDRRSGRERPAEAAEATVLSSITTVEFPHLYALREELRSYRFLQLDPIALRRPSPTIEARELASDGSNLATVLAKIQAETKTQDQPKGVLAEIATDLSTLITGVVGLDIVSDERNREYRVDVCMRDGLAFSSRVVSDGTLRTLALLTLLHDPKHHGLICLEEPENGVHPLRLKEMISLVRKLVTDPSSRDVEPQDTLSQMLLNSHSPVVLDCLAEGEAVFADMVSVISPNARVRRTYIRPVLSKLPLDDERYVSPVEVQRYLSTVSQKVLYSELSLSSFVWRRKQRLPISLHDHYSHCRRSL